MNIVFLHGGGQGAWIWDDTIAAMEIQASGQHRFVALDVPGCGVKRHRDTNDLPFHAIIEELLRDIDGLNLRDVLIIGHSQAGSIIPSMVEKRADLFSRIVYLSCVAPFAGATVPETAFALHAMPESPLYKIFGNPEVPPREQYRKMFCNDMSDTQADAFLSKLQFDNWPLSSVTYSQWSYHHLATVPSTYVICLQDVILPADAQLTFAARFEVEKIVRIDAGHQVQNTRAHGLAEVLLMEAQLVTPVE